MTNDELRTAITKALEDITITWKEGRNEAISFILAELQPLVDADRQEIERLKKALREIRNPYKTDSLDRAILIVSTALGEEK